MAEFCVDCWNRINKSNLPPSKYKTTKYLCLCEGCGKYKNVIITEKDNYFSYRTAAFQLPFMLIYSIFYLLWKLLALPFKLYKKKKHKS